MTERERFEAWYATLKFANQITPWNVWKAALAQSAEPIDGFGGNLDEAFDAEPVAWTFEEATYRENDVRGRGWVRCLSHNKPTNHWMLRNIVPLYLAPTIPEGWQLVPKEPTEEMLTASLIGTMPQDFTSAVRHQKWVAEVYRAMLAAVKEPK